MRTVSLETKQEPAFAPTAMAGSELQSGNSVAFLGPEDRKHHKYHRLFGPEKDTNCKCEVATAEHSLGSLRRTVALSLGLLRQLSLT